MNWYLEALGKYAVFTGRSRRKEYWFFVLFNLLISLGLGFLDGWFGLGGAAIGLLSGVYALAIVVPAIAVSVRRLHDTGKSGWWLLIGLVPLLGPLVLLFFMIQDGEPGSNRYGENPKGWEVRMQEVAGM
jgi:uncharacterized membrane protein YhaH (DUF805 family)